MLEENIKSKKDIPVINEEEFDDNKTNATDQFSKFSRTQTWFESKNWMILSYNNL